ncbi:hypothetical protein [Catellatospora sp. NPDC049133]|uniref:hypothetical protein n=1 Tax=Catellatospora sp. NPDC049133 TaxID=3155499 RepID=UPI00340F9F5B
MALDETQVFKFLALRAPERPLGGTPPDRFIRDPRSLSREGRGRLTELAQRLAVEPEAVQAWRQLDLSAVDEVAAARPRLLDAYRAASGDPGDGVAAARAAGVPQPALDREERLLGEVWDAVHTAYMTGSGAGPRLDAPVQALRVLHFVASLASEPRPTPARAVALLEATPLVPVVLRDAVAEYRTTASARADVDESPIRSEAITRLIQDRAAAQRLLDRVQRARPAAARFEQGPAGQRIAVALDTMPRPLAELTDDAEVALRDRLGLTAQASVPEAVLALRGHLSGLDTRAWELRTDSRFTTALAAHDGVDDIRRRLPAAKPDPGTAMDENVIGRIHPLGIGDLKVVKQRLLRYEAGEVAHIESVLRGEAKERRFRTLHRTENTFFTAEEETRDTERDTQSTERFEVKREAEQTVKEDMSVKAGLSVTGTFGPVVTTATGEFAYSTAKQESTRSSANYAREIVDRSVSKVQTKVRTERTVKTVDEVEEINDHRLDNVSGAEHISGVYRWVDKRYRAQVYNYGRRLMFEFVVPEPAAFYRAARTAAAIAPRHATPPEPFVNLYGVPLTPRDITEANYATIAATWGAKVSPPPPEYTYAHLALAKDSVEIAKAIGVADEKFVIPEGYELLYYSLAVSFVGKNNPGFVVHVGRDRYELHNSNANNATEQAYLYGDLFGRPEEITSFVGSVPVSVTGYDVLGYAANFNGYCRRLTTTLDKWRLATYAVIYDAYQVLQAAYDQKVAQAEAAAGIVISGQNPALNKQVQQTELKKLCLTLLTGEHFGRYHAVTDPPDKPAQHPEVRIDEALRNGPIIQFLEQAFEWEQMTYLYYPYFWGDKRRWVEVLHQSDTDPVFAQFLTAGAARVLVPVPMAYADAVLFMLNWPEPDLAKRVWRGGEPVPYDDLMYTSIVDEIKGQTDDLAGATPEGDPWDYTVPTTLVWLQPGPDLPVFE